MTLKKITDNIVYPLIVAGIIATVGGLVSFKVVEARLNYIEQEQSEKVDKDVFELIREDISEIKDDIKEIKREL